MKISKAKNKLHSVLRIILPLLCLATIAFIFGNSLQTASVSSAQSSAVVEVVKDVVEIVAPESQIAQGNPTALDLLHKIIRKSAHFLEFALLGGLVCWTYFVYEESSKKLYIPALALLPIPFIDESVQFFVDGRSSAITDVGIDLCGIAFGFLFAYIIVLCIKKIIRRVQSKKG